MPYKDLEKKREYNRRWSKNKRKGIKENISLKDHNQFPPIRIPDHIRPTKYPHYYVSNNGIAYREPRPIDKNGKYGSINEYGLIQLTTHLRGNPNYGEEFMYEGINIYFYDENGKNIGYKKRNIHQLVAETWIPNPYEYTEILHGDKGNRCNHVNNLRWGTHKENMKESSQALPEGSKRRNGNFGSTYEKKNGEWVLVPKDRTAWNKGLKGSSWNTGLRYKIPALQKPNGSVRMNKNGSKYIKTDGKWVYHPVPQELRKKRKNVKRKSLPDGTIRTRSDGTIWIKEDGKWVYQKKKSESISII